MTPRTLIVAIVLAANIAPCNAAPPAPSPEDEMHLAFTALEAGRPADAMARLETLVTAAPNFRLAHLMLGDLLAMKAGKPPLDESRAGDPEKLSELRAEMNARLSHYRQPPTKGLVPRYLLRLGSAHSAAVVVEASRSRAYVFENRDGQPRLVRDYYTTVGKHGTAKQREGDKKTPIGTYHLTSYIPGARLPDLYGWGAFPINYPNEWDVRLGRSGSGIWIHGVPSQTYARPPLASDGCLALANTDLSNLAKQVRPGVTPVVLAQSVEWVTPDILRSESERFLRTLEQWRLDWERRNDDLYAGHYSARFFSEGMDRPTWLAHKKRVNAAKKWLTVRLTDVVALRDPGTEPLVIVTFLQDYRSNDVSRRLMKRQYWIWEDARWKIAYEAPVGRAQRRLPESFQEKPRHASR